MRTFSFSSSMSTFFSYAARMASRSVHFTTLPGSRPTVRCGIGRATMSLVSMGELCVACVSCAAAGIETNDAQKMAQNTVKQGARFRLVILRATARGQLIFISLLRFKTAYRKLIRLVNLPSAFTRPRRQELQETWKMVVSVWWLVVGN